MGSAVKTYRPTWEGELVLACRKCQKKLKHKPGKRSLAKLKKTLQRAHAGATGRQLHVINVPCMDLCPKGGVTICAASHTPHQLSIIYSEQDLKRI